VRFTRPLVVDQFQLLKRSGAVQRDKPELVDAYGLRADKAKVFEWHFKRLSLPTGLLESPRAGVQVQAALDLADAVARALRTALKHLYPRKGEGNDLALGNLIRSAQMAFWSGLRWQFEGRFLSELARQTVGNLEAEELLLQRWQAVVREEGWRTLDAAIEPLDTGAAALRRQVQAREAFDLSLSKLLSAEDSRPNKVVRKVKE